MHNRKPSDQELDELYIGQHHYPSPFPEVKLRATALGMYFDGCTLEEIQTRLKQPFRRLEYYKTQFLLYGLIGLHEKVQNSKIKLSPFAPWYKGGGLLRALRDAYNEAQSDVALIIGSNRQRIGEYENGRIRPPPDHINRYVEHYKLGEQMWGYIMKLYEYKPDF